MNEPEVMSQLCWGCGKKRVYGMTFFCSRKCSIRGMNRSMFIKRNSKAAQMYYKLYDMDMQRLLLDIKE